MFWGPWTNDTYADFFTGPQWIAIIARKTGQAFVSGKSQNGDQILLILLRHFLDKMTKSTRCFCWKITIVVTRIIGCFCQFSSELLLIIEQSKILSNWLDWFCFTIIIIEDRGDTRKGWQSNMKVSQHFKNQLKGYKIPINKTMFVCFNMKGER